MQPVEELRTSTISGSTHASRVSVRQFDVADDGWGKRKRFIDHSFDVSVPDVHSGLSRSRVA
jgi:hypothetical protein